MCLSSTIRDSEGLKIFNEWYVPEGHEGLPMREFFLHRSLTINKPSSVYLTIIIFYYKVLHPIDSNNYVTEI